MHNLCRGDRIGLSLLVNEFVNEFVTKKLMNYITFDYDGGGS